MTHTAPGEAVAGAPGSLNALGERWLALMRTERDCSPRTLAAYAQDLRALARWLDGRSVATLTEHDVRRWIARAAREDLAPRSIARRLSGWRGFLDWCAQQGLCASNPVRGVRAPRAPRRLPKALPPDAAAQLMHWSADDEAFAALRDKAMLELFYSSGLRLSELTGLDATWFDEPEHRSQSWLDLDAGEVTVRGKGRKTRTVPVGSHARQALSQWLAYRARWLETRPHADRHALFLGARGARLANREAQRRVRAIGAQQGVATGVHPHVLRHSFASHLLQSSGDLRAVQELLGHASIASTQIYTALDFQRLSAVYDAAHPRARRKPAARKSAR